MASSLSQTALAAALLGVSTHLLFFIRGEHLVAAPKLFVVAVTAPILFTVALSNGFGIDFFAAVRITAALYSAYIGALWTSMLIYRAFFHRLGSFPGPFAARLTQLWHVSHTTHLDNHKHLHRLHAKYGDLVRTGPNTLSVTDPDFVDVVHNSHSTCTKSNWYSISYPMTTLQQMRDKPLHDRRRKHGWEKAFTMKALRDYDTRVVKYTDQLLNQLRESAGSSVNVTKWFNYYSFDVMGDLSFGRSFKALESGESHFFIDLLHEGGKAVGLLGSMPWVIQILTKLPAAINPIERVLRYSEDCVDERQKIVPDEPDIMSHLLEAGPFFEDPVTERLLLMGDARLLIIAGSDTTAATLVHAFYHLASDPLLVKTLRAEMDEYKIQLDNSFSIQALQALPYLNGIINETLRLHPAVPGGVYRDTPPEGLQVGDKFIPGNVTILTPNYSIQRSPKAFADPESFIPERWTTRPDLVLNKNAWFPFVIGRYSCIGRQLALMELRTVIAKTILEFDVNLAKGETGYSLLEQTQDIFTLALGKLELVFNPRN